MRSDLLLALWSGALGLALKDDVTALEVSRWVEGAVARAARRVARAAGLHAGDRGDAPARVPGGPGQPVRPQPRQLPSGTAGGVRPLIDRLQQVASETAKPLVPLPGRPPLDQTILDVETIDGDVRLWLHPALANAGMLAVVVVDASGRADLFRGLVRPPLLSGNPAILQADPVGPLGQLAAGSDLVAELAGAQAGAVLLASNDLVDLLGRRGGQPLQADVEIDIQILQNGDGRRALVIPVVGTATPGFAAAPAPPHASLARDRWETPAPPDALNTYARAATLSLDL